MVEISDAGAAPDSGVPQLRVLMLTTSYPSYESDPSGSFISGLARGIDELGVNVTVLCPSGAVDSGVDRSNVQVLRFRDPSGLTGSGGAIPRLRAQPWRLLALPALLYRMWREANLHARHASVVHAHWFVPSGAIAALCGKPFIVTAHGTDVSLAERWKVLRPLYRTIANRAVRVVAVGDGMRQRLEHIGLDSERIEVIRLGVRGSPPASGETAVQPVGGFVVGFVGSLTRNKSVDILMQAFARVAEPGWRLEIVGDGPEAASLTRLSTRLGISSATTFHGAIAPQAVDRAMERMSVLVLPSRSEGLGLVLAEGIRAGAAVIASDIPGPSDLVIDRETGCLVPPGDVEELSAALAGLAADPMMRDRLVVNARERLRQLGMTQQAAAAAHVTLYRAAASIQGLD